MAGVCGSTLYDCERRHAGGRRYLHDAHPYPRVKRAGSFGGYPSTEPGLKAATWDSHPCGVPNCLDLLALAGRLRLGSWGIILEFCHIALIEYILRDKGRHLPYLQKNGLSSTELPYLRPLPTAVMVCGKSNGTETF